MKRLLYSKCDESTAAIAIGCIICGEYTSLTPEEESALYRGKTIYKVCDKCRDAVIRMRSMEFKIVDPKIYDGTVETPYNVTVVPC